MMQLDRFLTGHFASHHSPTRERGEVWFAVTPGKKPDGKEAGNEKGKDETGTERTDQFTTTIRDSMTDVIPEVTIQDLSRVYDSAEAAECTGFNETETLTRLLEDKCSLVEGDQWRRILPKEEAKRIDAELRGEREKHMQESMKDEKTVLAIATALKTKADMVEGFSRGLERRITMIFGSAGVQNQEIARLFTQSDPTLDRDAIQLLVEKNAGVPWAIETQGADEMRRRVDLIVEAQSLLRKEQNAGRSRMIDDAPADYWKTYTAELTMQLRATEKLLDERLRKRSSDLETTLNSQWDRMVWECVGGENDSEAELDTRFLKKFGVTYEAAKEAYFEKRISLRRMMRDRNVSEDANPTPLPGSNDYLTYAHLSLERLANADEELETDDRFFEQQRSEQRGLEAWARTTGRMLREFRSRENDGDFMDQARTAIGEEGIETYTYLHDLLDPYVDAGKDLAQLRQDPEKRLTPTTEFDVPWKGQIGWTLTPKRQGDIAAVLTGLLDDPEGFAESRRRLQTIRDGAAPSGENRVEQEISEIRSRLDDVLRELLPEGKLCSALTHRVSETLHLQKEIVGVYEKINVALLRKSVTAADLKNLKLLEECLKSTKDIRVERASAAQMKAMRVPTDKRAWYERDTHTVYFRESLTETQREEAIQHEKGHAIIETVTRRSKLFPLLLTSRYRELEARWNEEHNTSFEALLQSMAEPWGIADQRDEIFRHWRKKYGDTQRAKNGAERAYRHILMDELINKHAMWKDRPLQETERQLFAMLDDPVRQRTDDNKNDVDDTPGIRMYMGDDDTEVENTDAATKSQVMPEENAPDIDVKATLEDIRKKIRKLEQFHQAYPQVPINPENLLEVFLERYDEANTIYISQDPETLQDNDELKALVRELQKATANISNQIDKIDSKKLNTTKAHQESEGIMSKIRFVSINDLVKLWEDTKHDIQHIYKRRQDKNLKDVGNPIMRALQIGKDIPLAGHYLHELHQYHERRYSGEEQKAANEWKEGLVNEDSSTIIRMIHGSHNKDQVRGIIALLCDRGEMDWNDEGVWDTLAHLSGFHHSFPTRACRRSDILRDVWLRKMITTIWKDKELYYQWRQSNDGKIDSGKKGFEPTVDQFSNVRGGMAQELEKQLELWVEWSSLPSGIRGKQPEDIKPHLYEEVITYAIERGKMSMEGKFYYLVQAIATGLLSIDRLRVLASKYLNAFPFIDYFYGRNNSLPEVIALAKRLQEPDEENRFKPGIRTTLWLHYEVAREKSAQERLSKALSGARAEGIDHEDVPFFITNVDASSVDSMTGAISGTRMKLSPEGTKNAYVGWNSKFKAFGALMEAEIGKDKLDRVSASDIDMLAQTLTGYIVYDNIITRNVTNQFADTERAVLTDNQFNSVPVSGVTITKDYRQGMIGFIKEIYDALGTKIQDNLNNDRLIQLLPPDKRVKAEEFLSLDINGPLRRNTQDRAADLYKYRANFNNAFTKAINDNPVLFKNILRTYANKETGTRFHNEGGSPDLKVKDAIQIMRERRNIESRAQQRQRAAH